MDGWNFEVIAVPLIKAVSVGIVFGISIGFVNQSLRMRKPSPIILQLSSENFLKNECKRVGGVIGLKKEYVETYSKLHANPWPRVSFNYFNYFTSDCFKTNQKHVMKKKKKKKKVLQRIYKSKIRNYSIFYFPELNLLFSHFEYIGDNFEEDMNQIGQDGITIKWWKECEPCQVFFFFLSLLFF